jgi:hypothetical protein
MPREPLRGLRVDVRGGANPACFDRWRVVRCAREAFTVREGRHEETHPASAWAAWLAARCREGAATVHLPGCVITRCHGCDGSQFGRPARVLLFPTPLPAGARVRR